MNFHEKYERLNCFLFNAEFRLKETIAYPTGIVGYEYEDKLVKINKLGLVTIKKGFRWSASGPTADTRSSRLASCVHDSLYYLSDKGLFKGENSKKVKAETDHLFYMMLLEGGMWAPRAYLWWKSVHYWSWAWESTE